MNTLQFNHYPEEIIKEVIDIFDQCIWSLKPLKYINNPNQKFDMKKLEYSNGDKMDAIGLGTWKSAPGEVGNAVIEAVKMGYRHIDCAAIYNNEKEIGEALTKIITEGVVKREELWITSKLWNNAHKRQDVVPALKRTLDDLQLDYLDLYLIHWPVAFKPDQMFPDSGEGFLSLNEVPVSETWQGMEECVSHGLAKHIGVSNFSAKKIKSLMDVCQLQPEMNQVELHPFLQQNDLFDYCSKNGIHMTAYSPLGSLDRAPQMKKDNEPSLLENETILKIAENNNCSSAQVLISWAAQRGTSVIPKSVNPVRLKQNLDASQITLSDADMDKIRKLDQHYRIVDGSFWEKEGNDYTVANLWDE